MKNSLPAIVLLSFGLLTFGSAAHGKNEAELLISGSARNLRFASFGGEQQWATLAAGVHPYSGDQRYQWIDIPAELQGVRFLLLPKHTGVLKFKTSSPGFVFFATSKRGFASGNSSGDWRDEVLFEKDLRRRGWKILRTKGELRNDDTGVQVIYYRVCSAGEEHEIRTEKYAAPMLLVR